MNLLKTYVLTIQWQMHEYIIDNTYHWQHVHSTVYKLKYSYLSPMTYNYLASSFKLSVANNRVHYVTLWQKFCDHYNQMIRCKYRSSDHCRFKRMRDSDADVRIVNLFKYLIKSQYDFAMHICQHKCMHVQHTGTYACQGATIYAYMLAFMHAYVQLCQHICIHAHIHAFSYAYMST